MSAQISPVPQRVISALRETAARLRDGAHYEWGNAGACNCGHLAQTLTAHSQAAIYREVAGEWSEHLRDYCPITGESLDTALTQMLAAGFAPGELAALEHLCDDRVLRRLPPELRHLRRNDRDHVILYMETWAEMLEAPNVCQALALSDP